MKSCVCLSRHPAPLNGLPLRTHDNQRYVKLSEIDRLTLFLPAALGLRKALVDLRGCGPWWQWASDCF
jgi:hypothetical protein